MANTYQDALIDQLDPTLRKPTGGTMYGEVAGPPIQNTGIFGERPDAMRPKPTGGDQMGIAASWDTTNMSDAQRNKFQQDTQSAMQRDAAGNQADLDYLAKNGGNWGSRQQYRPGAMPNAGDYGGISEGGSLVPPMSPEATAPNVTATPATAAQTRDFGRLVGYDEGKFNDPNKQSAKYQIGRALSSLDPRQGITPEALAALNALGFGNFTGQGDKLSLSGLTDKGRQAGLAGDYRDADFIAGFKGGNGKWTYADPAEEARQAAAGGGMGAHGGGNFISPVLAGQDAGGNIQSALGKLGQPSDLIQQLIAKLQGAA